MPQSFNLHELLEFAPAGPFVPQLSNVVNILVPNCSKAVGNWVLQQHFAFDLAQLWLCSSQAFATDEQL